MKDFSIYLFIIWLIAVIVNLLMVFYVIWGDLGDLETLSRLRKCNINVLIERKLRFFTRNLSDYFISKLRETGL